MALYAFSLVREQCLDEEGIPELRRMASFFGTASERLSQLMSIVSARDNNHWHQGHPR